jgi:hypothetical protein
MEHWQKLRVHTAVGQDPSLIPGRIKAMCHQESRFHAQAKK